MIFLATGSRDIIHAGRMSEGLGLIEESDRSDVRNHETGGRSGMRSQEWRKMFVDVRIDEPVDPALADVHQIGNRDRSIVEGECQRRCMEIAAAQDVSALEDQRIVGARTVLDLEKFAYVGEDAADCAVNLRHAPEAVGVLN